MQFLTRSIPGTVGRKISDTVPNNEDCMLGLYIYWSETLRIHWFWEHQNGGAIDRNNPEIDGYFLSTKLSSWDLAFLGFSYVPFFDVSYRR